MYAPVHSQFTVVVYDNAIDHDTVHGVLPLSPFITGNGRRPLADSTRFLISRRGHPGRPGLVLYF